MRSFGKSPLSAIHKRARRATAFGVDEQLRARVLGNFLRAAPPAIWLHGRGIRPSICRYGGPVRRATCWPRNMSGRKRISRSSGRDWTTSTALEEVQQMSDSAFTAAEVLTYATTIPPGCSARHRRTSPAVTVSASEHPLQVGQQDGPVRGQQLGRLGHEVDPAEHDHVGVAAQPPSGTGRGSRPRDRPRPGPTGPGSCGPGCTALRASASRRTSSAQSSKFRPCWPRLTSSCRGTASLGSLPSDLYSE